MLINQGLQTPESGELTTDSESYSSSGLSSATNESKFSERTREHESKQRNRREAERRFFERNKQRYPPSHPYWWKHCDRQEKSYNSDATKRASGSREQQPPKSLLSYMDSQEEQEIRKQHELKSQQLLWQYAIQLTRPIWRPWERILNIVHRMQACTIQTRGGKATSVATSECQPDIYGTRSI